MANTYHQIFIHLIFAVGSRQCLITDELQPKLYSYIAGILRQMDHHPIKIGGMPDHVHILFGYDPQKNSIPDIVQRIKISTNKWMKQALGVSFEWQRGYGCFSYSYASLQNVVRYIERQKYHHLHLSFRDEYIRFLNGFNINYDERYIFHEPD
jgi:REP element-mobilizing transposase RayT